jgi:predicted Fe-Mo cluster-binding NifX family protein
MAKAFGKHDEQVSEKEDRMADSQKIRVAIPSMWPGGLGAVRSGHFGRCDCFTLVDLDREGVQSVHIVPNPPHEQGGCLGPVRLLEKHDAAAIIVHGIGMRPLMGFRQAGIEVYQGEGMGIQETVQAFLADEISVIDESQVCGG